MRLAGLRLPVMDRPVMGRQASAAVISGLRHGARSLKWAARAALELALPEYCIVCRREGRYICGDCEASDVNLPPLTKPYCVLCAAPGVPQLCGWCRQSAPSFHRARAPYEFRGAARRAVHDLKYRHVRIAAPHMARLLAADLRRNPHPADAYIPVPLHPRRQRSRGFNQSELMARELGKLTGVPVRTDALRRLRNTPPQVSMETSGARRRNIADAFVCGADLAGMRCIVIDDVLTTGSTMSACADALLDAGAAHVWGLAFARQVSFGDDDDGDAADAAAGWDAWDAGGRGWV